MGFLADILASPKTFNARNPHDSTSRLVTNQIQHLIDVGFDTDYPAGTAAANDQMIVPAFVSGAFGRYSLSFTLHSGLSFATALLSVATAIADIQTAIDTAATTAAVPGYTNGDIAVSGAPLSTGPVTVTFGGSVGNVKNGLIVVNVSNLGSDGPGDIQPVQNTVIGNGTTNAVQTIPQYLRGVGPYDVIGGTFTLTFTLAGSATPPFTTAAINWNASSSTVLGAINTAATNAGVVGWTNGSIQVSGNSLNGLLSAPLVFTYSGVAVKHAAQALVVPDSTNLIGEVSGIAGAPTNPVPGQTNRPAWAALKSLSIVTSAPPPQGSPPVNPTVTNRRGHFPHGLHELTVRAFIKEAAFNDQCKAVETVLLKALGY
jgi:hypothetical protein